MVMKKIFAVAVLALCLSAIYSCEDEKKDPIKEKVEYFKNRNIPLDDNEAWKKLNDEVAEYVVSLSPEDRDKFAKYSGMESEELVSLIDKAMEPIDPVKEQVEYFYKRSAAISPDDYVGQEQLNNEMKEYYNSLTPEETERFYDYLVEMQDELN